MFNDQVFNGVSTIPSAIVSDNPASTRVSYNGYTLHDGVSIFASWKYLNGKRINFDSDPYDKEDGVIYNVRKERQEIEIMGVIQKASRGDLLTTIDSIKSALAQDNKTLYIKEGTQERQVKATMQSVEFSQNHYNVEWEDFKIIFTTYDFWHDVSPISDIVDGITSGSYTYPWERVGTAQSKAFILMTFTAATGVTSITVQIGSAILTIPTAITAGDSIIIDTRAVSVKKNGVDIVFDGPLPKLRNANNDLIITVNGSARAYNLTTMYNPSYI